MDAGLLIVRLVFGGLMAAHGAQKLFGWFGGYGFSAVSGFFETLGFRPGRFFAAAASATELVGGLLVAAGLLGPVGPALVLAVMIVAAITVHVNNGLFAQTNGIEVPLMYAVAAIGIALTGAGAYSFDALFRLENIWTAPIVWSVLLAGAIGGALNVAVRRTPAQVPTAS
jgi:putative oxidoreductase